KPQTTIFSPSQQKPELRPNKDFEAKYNQVKAKLALLSSVKVLMALADDENVAVGKESAKNGEWVNISIRKVHILLDMKDNDERKYFLYYLCIDLNCVKDQRNNLVTEILFKN
ncbi:hypothetical protein Tco_0136751, partial [Tanacetum coccineum]